MVTVDLLTFSRGGIHPGAHKEATAGKPIEDLPPPREVRLPLLQHLGDPATPLVKKGDLVARGQPIAEGAANGVPLHATISGKVKPIDRWPHPTLVSAPAIVIVRQDGAPPELEFPEDPEWRACPRVETLARIREAGIVGLGGAAFPTWRKLALPEGVTVDTLILNGAECEPYLTADDRLMVSRAADMIEGGGIMARLVGARRVMIGVEADKGDAARALEAAIASLPASVPVTVVRCETRYPQGAERQLVFALTGRVMPPRALPSAVGVLVQNVATAAAVHDAVRFQRPLLDRVVTVSGPGIATPRNVRAPLGTLLSDLVAFCGGLSDDATRLVAGGPMMGRALPRLDLPLVKGMNGLVALRRAATVRGAGGTFRGRTFARRGASAVELRPWSCLVGLTCILREQRHRQAAHHHQRPSKNVAHGNSPL
jgi:electron transport complex protein RnfC